MGLFTQHGLYSIVADREEPGRHLVRARVRVDLENLIEFPGLPGKIRATPAAKYGYRLAVKVSELRRIMRTLADTIDYPNFKAQIARRSDQADRSALDHRIWTEAAQLPSTHPTVD